MFVAYTRFSLFLPNSRAWIISKDRDHAEDVDQYKSTLFNNKRLQFRMKFLKTLTLPLLQEASEGYKFIHFIEYSSLMPALYIEELKKLESNYDFLHLIEYDEKGCANKSRNEEVIKKFNLKESIEEQYIGMFALDDDDCVSLDFFEKNVRYISKPYKNFVISNGLGIHAFFDEKERVTKITEAYFPKVNIGQIRVGYYSSRSPDVIHYPRLRSHMFADKDTPLILDSRSMSFFWSHHIYQDTKNRSAYNASIKKMMAYREIEKKEVLESFGASFLLALQSMMS